MEGKGYQSHPCRQYEANHQRKLVLCSARACSDSFTIGSAAIGTVASLIIINAVVSSKVTGAVNRLSACKWLAGGDISTSAVKLLSAFRVGNVAECNLLC